MKRKFCGLFVAVVCSLFAHTVLAQGVYVNINGGVSTQLGAGNISGFNNYSKTSNSVSIQQVDVSLGQGVNLGGAVGYMFNKNIGVELGLNCLLGDKFNMLNQQPDETIHMSLSSTMLRINPSIILATTLSKIQPYAKFGLLIGVGKIYQSVKDEFGTNVVISDFKMNGGLAYGASASIGALYKLSKKISVFGEISSVNLSYAPKKGLYTYFNYNGTEETLNLKTKYKEIHFVDSYSYNPNVESPEMMPGTGVKQYYPFSSLELNIGLRFNL